MYNEAVMDHFMNPRNVGSLPDADGVSLIRQLKADEATRAMPVVVVSGDVARGRVRGRSLEVADWVEKPVDQDRLRQAVRALFSADDKPVVLHVDDDRDILLTVHRYLEHVHRVPLAEFVRDGMPRSLFRRALHAAGARGARGAAERDRFAPRARPAFRAT